jgi:hypothetical protein
VAQGDKIGGWNVQRAGANIFRSAPELHCMRMHAAQLMRPPCAVAVWEKGISLN